MLGVGTTSVRSVFPGTSRRPARRDAEREQGSPAMQGSPLPSPSIQERLVQHDQRVVGGVIGLLDEGPNCRGR